MRLSLHADNTTVHLAGAARVSQPAPGSVDVDLRGCRLLPGLLNAHDHLELNHYPRTSFRARYTSAHDWGADVNAHLDDEPFRSLRALPLRDRCLIGGLKNLLSGVTTVVQHGPLHPPLRRPDFPVRVISRYGWSHSLHFDSDEQVRASYAATPPDVPWFIHLAEGTDARARTEYKRLVDLGCARPNTVLVHAVGLTPADITHAAAHIRGVVVCPTTNRYLLDATPGIDNMRAAGLTIGLGSDSRLTADGDLLSEPDALDPEVQAASWRLLAMEPPENDWIALRGPGKVRTDIALIVIRGEPVVAEPEIAAQLDRKLSVAVTIDGKPRMMTRKLANMAAKSALAEPGFLVQSKNRRFWWR